MKLLTIKQIINGRYKNESFDGMFSVVSFVSLFTSLLYAALNMSPNMLINDVCKIALTSFGILFLIFTVLSIIGLYFWLCVNYIEK